VAEHFFASRAPGEPGLALFLNAGDPPLDQLPGILRALDAAGLDCLELAVPFPDSPTDGPVIRRSADRALAGGVGLDDVLDVVAATRPSLHRLRIALFADWSYSVRHRSLDDVLLRVTAADLDGFLLHGLPPRLRPDYRAVARYAGLPIVTTCYATSPPEVIADAAEHATAYLYLVAQYGRSGTTKAPDEVGLVRAIDALRTGTDAPIAVGFGVRTAADVARVHRLGADAAIVGTAAVAEVERIVDPAGTGAVPLGRHSSAALGDAVTEALVDLVRSLRPAAPARPTSPLELVHPAQPVRQAAVTGAGPPFTGHGSVHDWEAAR
jgi:tryptophan synthase alpha chain